MHHPASDRYWPESYLEKPIKCPLWALWSCSDSVDGFMKTGCLLFKLNRAELKFGDGK